MLIPTRCGEVFDDVYMPANTDGEPMHRDLAELSYILDHESARPGARGIFRVSASSTTH